MTLLLGNRDLNKMRLSSELQPSQLKRELLPRLPGPYWVPEAKRVTPMAYLRKRVAKKLSVKHGDDVVVLDDEDSALDNDQQAVVKAVTEEPIQGACASHLSNFSL